MARVQKPQQEMPENRKKPAGPVVQPTGHFVRGPRIHVSTERSPRDVTAISPDDMEPILPEMPYLPPA